MSIQVKPPPKPAMAVKPNVCNIYAAPTVATSRSVKPPVASRPTSISNTTTNKSALASAASATTTSHEPHSGGSGCSSSEMSDKEKDKDELLGISHRLETSIDAVSKSDLKNRSSLLKLSEDIGTLTESANSYVDNVPATGRFRFRSLLNKLEQQSGELRSSSVGKSHASSEIPAKICGDIKATVRDLVTVIQR